MGQENIMICRSLGVYTVVDLCQNRFYGYQDSHNYYDIDVDNMLLFKKSNNNKCNVRYFDVNKLRLVRLQLKIKNSYGEIHTIANNNEVMYIHSDDKELFKKCREIWNKIIELKGVNNPEDFVETTLDNGD